MTSPAADKGCIGLDTQRIRKLRESLGLTQADAAKRAKLPGAQFWSEMERAAG